jgi:DNA repair photolyase
MVPYKDMRAIQEIRSSSILTPQKFGSLSDHYDYTINPYAGCAFGCSYCYVPKFPGNHKVGEWGSWVNVKVNAPELLRKDRTKIFGSRIFFSSATDPYQYLELKYRLTRACLKELLNYPPQHLTMHTRSHLMLQDIDLLRAFGKKLIVGISLPTDDDLIRQEFEPKAPSIMRRLELMRKLSESGVAVYASVSPLLPCDPDRLVRSIAPFTSSVWVDTMNWLEVMRSPELLLKYKSFFESEKYERLAVQIAQKFESQKDNRDNRFPNRGSGTEIAHVQKTKQLTLSFGSSLL